MTEPSPHCSSDRLGTCGNGTVYIQGAERRSLPQQQQGTRWQLVKSHGPKHCQNGGAWPCSPHSGRSPWGKLSSSRASAQVSVPAAEPAPSTAAWLCSACTKRSHHTTELTPSASQESALNITAHTKAQPQLRTALLRAEHCPWKGLGQQGRQQSSSHSDLIYGELLVRTWKIRTRMGTHAHLP